MRIDSTVSATMTVDICREPALWDAYVEAAPDASNYHRWVWKQVIEATFGHQTYYLAAAVDGFIQGVLPLVSLRSKLFGHFLVSVPFFNYGGVLASAPEARDKLLAKAVEIAQELGARHIELRQGISCDVGWPDVTGKVGMQVELPGSAGELFRRFSGKLRNRIRHSEKQGLRSEWGGNEAVDGFYRVFAANMRNLGTPVYPRELFENMCRRLPTGVRILTVRDEGRPVAAAFVAAFRDTLEVPWSASLSEARRKYAAVFLEWKMLEWAADNGYRRMDLGRSTPGSSSYEFKRQWMSQERPLHWYYWLAPGVAVPELRPNNPRYHWATRVWKHLPLYLANRLGPRIVRSIP